jgi:hypothetical protein
MKAKVMSVFDRAMLLNRYIIETINNQLKNISQIEHSRYRSEADFMLNVDLKNVLLNRTFGSQIYIIDLIV